MIVCLSKVNKTMALLLLFVASIYFGVTKAPTTVAGLPCFPDWSMLWTSSCGMLRKWHCLRLFPTNEYHSECKVPKAIPRGHYAVSDPKSKNIDQASCPIDRYQPVQSLSNQSNECVYKKSLCSEEGQIYQSNGTPTEDSRCRCDYARQYHHISNHVRKGCTPSKEDCSCYKKGLSPRKDLKQVSKKKTMATLLFGDPYKADLEYTNRTDRSGTDFGIFISFITIALVFSCVAFCVLVLLSYDYIELPLILDLKTECDIEMGKKTSKINDHTTTEEFDKSAKNCLENGNVSDKH